MIIFHFTVILNRFVQNIKLKWYIMYIIHKKDTFVFEKTLKIK
jgi:hypothetical protein